MHHRFFGGANRLTDPTDRAVHLEVFSALETPEVCFPKALKASASLLPSPPSQAERRLRSFPQHGEKQRKEESER